MLQTFREFNHFARTVALLGMTGLVGTGMYLGYRTFHARDVAEQELREKEKQISEQAGQIKELQTDVESKRKQIEQLDTSLRLLKTDHRVARIVVSDQRPAQNRAMLATTFQFFEIDDAGRALEEPRTYTIDGDRLYVDAYVVKFDDRFVEQGDPLRGTSIFLFKRLWGEYQNPTDGYVLDRVRARPVGYSDGHEMSDFEKRIWNNFWDLANDPERLAAAGIRSAHGEAPSMRLKKGMSYRLNLRASGGLSFEPETQPEVKAAL